MIQVVTVAILAQGTHRAVATSQALLLQHYMKSLPCVEPYAKRRIISNKVHPHRDFRWRPYRVECTGSLLTSEVKRHRAWLVLGWGTAWEHPQVLPAFHQLLLAVGAAKNKKEKKRRQTALLGDVGLEYCHAQHVTHN